MHQHPVPHPSLGQAGEAHLLAYATEIHLGDAPEGIGSGERQGRIDGDVAGAGSAPQGLMLRDRENLAGYGQAHAGGLERGDLQGVSSQSPPHRPHLAQGQATVVARHLLRPPGLQAPAPQTGAGGLQQQTVLKTAPRQGHPALISGEAEPIGPGRQGRGQPLSQIAMKTSRHHVHGRPSRHRLQQPQQQRHPIELPAA